MKDLQVLVIYDYDGFRYEWVEIKVRLATSGRLTWNTCNELTFDKVTTSQVRISFVHSSGQVAISEFECY